MAEPQIANPALQNLAMEEAGYGRWHEAFIEDDLIMGCVADFPASERALLNAQDIKSLLVVPIKVGGEPWGVLGFDDCRTEREWADWEVALLRSVATTIGLRLAQLEREVALRQAREANRAKSAFLATMSHEIRTPLNAVIGMASLFEETTLDAQHRDYIRTILNSSQALLDVINDILDYSKIESGKLELEAVPFQLSAVCALACDILRGQARAKGIELISCSPDGAADHFFGDPTRLRQVVLNLLSNAIKFTPQGSVTLRIEPAGRLDERGHWPVAISVQDTGIGMTEEVRARLFQPFTQGDATTTRRFGGTGLGLVITRRLVEIMGGEIEVESAPGEGSRFTIKLPLTPAPTDVAARMAAGPAELPSGLRALVVDDLPVNRELLVEWLGSWGVRAVAVDGAAAALERLRSESWNLLLTDYHMPEVDGGELLVRLEALRLEAPPVVILLSSDSTVPAEVRARCAAVKVKPLWPQPLRQVIAESMRGRAPVKAVAPPAVALASPATTGTLRVLVAEDNPQNQKVVLLMLKRHGITPTLANNGVEAVAAAERQVFDLAMLDMQMPEMDGLEASRRICRRYPDEAERPLMVAFTANVFAEEREAARLAGLPHFVTKPMTNAQLTEVLRLAEAHRAARRF